MVSAAHVPQPHTASPWLFFAALACFVLPWVNFTCESQPVFQMAGYHLVMGGKADDLLLIKPRDGRSISQDDLRNRPNQRERRRNFASSMPETQPNSTASSWSATFFPGQSASADEDGDRPGYFTGDARAAAALACLIGAWCGSMRSTRRHAASLAALAMTSLFALLWMLPRLNDQNLSHSLDHRNPLIIGGAICVGLCLALMVIERIMQRNNLAMPVALAGLAVASLLWLKTAMARDIARESDGVMQAAMLGGFWATIALSAAGGVSWLMAAKPVDHSSPAPANPPPTPSFSGKS